MVTTVTPLSKAPCAVARWAVSVCPPDAAGRQWLSLVFGGGSGSTREVCNGLIGRSKVFWALNAHTVNFPVLLPCSAALFFFPIDSEVCRSSVYQVHAKLLITVQWQLLTLGPGATCSVGVFPWLLCCLWLLLCLGRSVMVLGHEIQQAPISGEMLTHYHPALFRCS
jgi:hypothetical protein